MEKIDFENRQIQLSIVLKLHQLQRNDLNRLLYEHIEEYLEHVVWKKAFPTTLHEAVNDILKVDAASVIQYLTSSAIVEGYYRPLSEFTNLINKGGKESE